MPRDTQLHKAANQGDVEQCRVLVENGEVEVNEKGAQDRTALHRAIGANQLLCAKELVELGADSNAVDKAGRTPLHWAVIGGHPECIKYLLSLKPDLNATTRSGNAVLHTAVDCDKEDIIIELIKYHEEREAQELPSFDFEMKNGEGLTAFEMAKAKKNKMMCLMLKERKTDVNPDSAACTIA